MLRQIKRLFKLVTINGFERTVKTVISKFVPQKWDFYPNAIKYINGKKGLEIAGPSGFFMQSSICPIYNLSVRLDNCNYSTHTIWQEDQSSESYFVNGKKMGDQYINDATALSDIDNEEYDFLINSHLIEHIANPIKAMHEWIRVLKKDGVMLIVVPHKDGTFDYSRPTTPLEHLVDDFKKDITEDDLTHYEEFVSCKEDIMKISMESEDFFYERNSNNYKYRSIHHHVFDTRLVAKLFDFMNLQILDIACFLPYNILCFGKKINGKADNSKFLDKDIGLLIKSPFPSDRSS